MSIAYRFPEAFRAGADACAAHYAKVDAGLIAETDAPPNPYPVAPINSETEWHAYNAGWNQAVPE
ncbi:MAG: hypothetical protein M0Z99_32145 [Betaproteobacteria bacterium]|nr:hypothetical protein [Betaproteobacteria bacterium]